MEFPGKQLRDYIKLIGDEWNNLPTEQKNIYLEEAEQDKARYNRELEVFFTKRPDVLAVEIARNKMQRKNSLPPNAMPPIFNDKPKAAEKPKSVDKPADKTAKVEKEKPNPEKRNSSISSTCTSKSQTPESVIFKSTINVFTDDFLEHNKCVDSELRTLRKSNLDYEMQNSVLEKHVENMKAGVEKLGNDNSDLQEKNKLLETYLTNLKAKLVKSLTDHGATPENLDKILTDLQKSTPTNNKSKENIRKLDLSLKA